MQSNFMLYIKLCRDTCILKSVRNKWENEKSGNLKGKERSEIKDIWASTMLAIFYFLSYTVGYKRS